MKFKMPGLNASASIFLKNRVGIGWYTFPDPKSIPGGQADFKHGSSTVNVVPSSALLLHVIVP